MVSTKSEHPCIVYVGTDLQRNYIILLAPNEIPSDSKYCKVTLQVESMCVRFQDGMVDGQIVWGLQNLNSHCNVGFAKYWRCYDEEQVETWHVCIEVATHVGWAPMGNITKSSMQLAAKDLGPINLELKFAKQSYNRIKSFFGVLWASQKGLEWESPMRGVN